MNGQWRKTIFALVVDARADATQRIHQVADWPLVHPRHTREAVLAVGECQRCREWTEGGASVAEKEIGFLDWEWPADAF